MVEKYLRDGCGCDLTDGGCSTRFTADSLESYRREVSELTLVELDMALLGQLSAFTNSNTLTVHSTKDRHPATNRQPLLAWWRESVQEDLPLPSHNLRQEAPQPAAELERERTSSKATWQPTQATTKYHQLHRHPESGRIPANIRRGQRHPPSWTNSRIQTH